MMTYNQYPYTTTSSTAANQPMMNFTDYHPTYHHPHTPMSIPMPMIHSPYDHPLSTPPAAVPFSDLSPYSNPSSYFPITTWAPHTPTSAVMSWQNATSASDYLQMAPVSWSMPSPSLPLIAPIPLTKAKSAPTITPSQVTVPSTPASQVSLPYKCDQCDKAFGRKNSLRRHAYLHTGLKPYKCEPCRRSFSRQDIFKRHCNSPRCQRLTQRCKALALAAATAPVAQPSSSAL